MTYGSTDGLIEVTVKVLIETKKAIQVDHGGDWNVWLPKSQIEDWPDLNETGPVLIQEWLAKEKGLI